MGFLKSDPKIYNVMQTKPGSWYDKLVKEDYLALFIPLMQKGYNLDTDGRWKQVGGQYTMLNATPWCHQRGMPKLHCSLDHQIIFNMFNIIPPRCLKCWKVCITINSFHELVQIEQLLHNLDYPSKCGIEMRDYTPKHYGAYFYCNGFDEGRARYTEVRKVIDDNIELTDKDKPIEVILKRGCTEYEMIKGPSPYWNCSGADLEMVKLCESFIEISPSNSSQDPLQKTNVKRKWMLWAHSNGDMSYLPYNGGEKLFPDYVKYHEGDIDDIKRDLCISNMQGTTGMAPEITAEFLEKVGDFAKEKGIENTGTLTYALGNYMDNAIDPGILRKVPEEVIGEHDELT
jgi:hypothetical protein